MKSRRMFLKTLAPAGALLLPGSGVIARPLRRKTPTLGFTRHVRETTESLVVPSTRWRWIVVHHSAIRFGNASIYDRAHRERGMENGLAYHFVIGNGVDSKDGQIEIGPRWLRQIKGGHVHREEINEIGIGICLVGNFEETHPTSRQLSALKELMDYLCSDVVARKVRVAVHREVDPGRTACPGRLFPAADLHQRYGRLSPRELA